MGDPTLASACAAIKACATARYGTLPRSVIAGPWTNWDDAALAAVVAALLPPSDPTVHALAVLGARCVRMATVNTKAVVGEVLTSPLVEFDGWKATYATPQIAATVARLTNQQEDR